MTTEPAPQEYALPALPECFKIIPHSRTGGLSASTPVFTADQMQSYARAALAARDAAQGDQVADVAIALEQQRALKIVADVAALRSGRDMTEAFDAGFVTACDEIDLRLRTERWALGGVDGPLPAARDDARDATGRSAKDYAIEHAEYLSPYPPRGATTPWSKANTTAAARSRTPSARKIFPTWLFTVTTEMTSSAAISSLVRPRPISSSTVRSRAVSRPFSCWRSIAAIAPASTSVPAIRVSPAVTPAASAIIAASHARLGEDSGIPNGIRTRAAAVKGRSPRPLDDGDLGCRRRSSSTREQVRIRRGLRQHRGRSGALPNRRDRWSRAGHRSDAGSATQASSRSTGHVVTIRSTGMSSASARWAPYPFMSS